MIQSYFNYCCEVWGVFGETQSKQLQRLQNRATRIIANMPNDTNQQTALNAVNYKHRGQKRI